MKLQNYEIVVKNHHHEYQIQLSTNEIDALKKQGRISWIKKYRNNLLIKNYL